MKKYYAPDAETSSPANDNEWFFETDGDKTMGIETITYSNGGKKKRCTLSNGSVAECRRLKGKDSLAIQRLTSGDEEKYKEAIMAESTTIDGKRIIIEDIAEFWYDDYIKLAAMSMVNFPSPQNA